MHFTTGALVGKLMSHQFHRAVAWLSGTFRLAAAHAKLRKRFLNAWVQVMFWKTQRTPLWGCKEWDASFILWLARSQSIFSFRTNFWICSALLKRDFSLKLSLWLLIFATPLCSDWIWQNQKDACNPKLLMTTLAFHITCVFKQHTLICVHYTRFLPGKDVS